MESQDFPYKRIIVVGVTGSGKSRWRKNSRRNMGWISSSWMHCIGCQIGSMFQSRNFASALSWPLAHLAGSSPEITGSRGISPGQRLRLSSGWITLSGRFSGDCGAEPGGDGGPRNFCGTPIANVYCRISRSGRRKPAFSAGCSILMGRANANTRCYLTCRITHI